MIRRYTSLQSCNAPNKTYRQKKTRHPANLQIRLCRSICQLRCLTRNKVDRFVKLGVVRDVEDRLLNVKKRQLRSFTYSWWLWYIHVCISMFVYPPYLMVGWGFAYQHGCWFLVVVSFVQKFLLEQSHLQSFFWYPNTCQTYTQWVCCSVLKDSSWRVLLKERNLS